MLVPGWLEKRAAGLPDMVAVSIDDRRVTYAELDARAVDTAVRLRERGIGAGDRVAVLFNNGLHFVVMLHALIKLGAILVPLNTRLTAAEIAWQLDDVRAKLLIFDAANEVKAGEIEVGMPLPQVWADEVVGEVAARMPLLQERRIDLDATLCIIYTSGTTGKPKGVMLTYGNFWWGAVGSAFNLGTHTDDVWLAVLPFFHVGGLAILLRSVIYGVGVIIHERFDPEAVNRAIENEGVTIISVVANMLQRMLDARAYTPYPPTLRCLLLGGGPAPRPLLERCAAIGAPVVQSYGMTETASQAATLSPADALRKLGSAGKPLLHLELRIERDGVVLTADEIGEIVVRGGSVTPGYADRPEATAAAIRDGWLYTGDLGMLDGEGYLYVMDRRDDLIISGGENVYPAEVEAALLEHPDVAEVGVVGLPDERWGQVVAAAVVLRDGANIAETDIMAWVGSRLARYKVPSHILFRDSLPRTASGKILRREIREDIFTTKREKGRDTQGG